MKTFLQLTLVALFLSAIFFFVYKTENKQTFVQDNTAVVEKKVEVDTTQINNVKYVKIAGVQVKVDLALTPETKLKGLSVKDEIGANEGMLFVFAQPGKYSFWMKDMKFAIDIIWIEEGGRVVSLEKNVPVNSYPEIFRSEEDATYVLEVSAGFADKYNLQVGDKAEFVY
jgi:uncharacterized membrane protein (UPF0127 family)